MSGGTGVYKHVIVVEVLAERPDISGWSLKDIAEEMDYGEFMGVSMIKDVRELDRMEVFDEAEAMGGEGEFFIRDEEEEYA